MNLNYDLCKLLQLIMLTLSLARRSVYELMSWFFYLRHFQLNLFKLWWLKSRACRGQVNFVEDEQDKDAVQWGNQLGSC